jgi:hypothetical protein
MSFGLLLRLMVLATSQAATIQANSVALGTDTTGNYVQSVANGSYLTGGGAASEGAALTLGVDAASINTASKVVARDASGNFAAGTITAALTGNASTATTLQTARTIGGVSFDGSANINLPGVNTAGTQATSGNAATATLAASATVLQTARTIGGVSFDGSAAINLPGVNTAGTQATSGNAGSATVLQTARNINGVAFNGSADITVADSTKMPTSGGTFTGGVTVNGSVTVGNTTSSDIYMVDTDEGTRRIHCNSNRIGFLKQDDNWGSYCDDDGSWTSVGNVTAYSDVRLKSNIQTIESGLDKVCAMRGVTFEKDGVRNLGVIAQEVEAVIPEVVHTQNDGMKSVAYGNIVGVLIEAIKELKQEIETLKGN